MLTAKVKRLDKTEGMITGTTTGDLLRNADKEGAIWVYQPVDGGVVTYGKLITGEWVVF